MTTNVFPESGIEPDKVLADLEALASDDLRADGRAFAFVYDGGKDVAELSRRAFAASMGGNGLDPTAYPSARRLENDLVAAAASHLRAPDSVSGTVTSGGTESVMLSVKAARDYARKTRPEVTTPRMLVPETAHACFHKAAHYFGVELVVVAIDPKTMRADVEDMSGKLDDNTILLVGSAPSYAHGVVDPIEEIAALARERGIPMHVDACIGGWVLPFKRELGAEFPNFDFSVDGVTSISVDLHKYAFAPKGCSVLLHRDRTLRDAQYYACANWSGYCVVNPTMLGSRSLAAMGAAWAVLRGLGRSGYRERFERMMRGTHALVEGVASIDGLRVLGSPDMGLVAVASESGDVFTLADRLTALGWHVQPTYAVGSSPAHVHFTVEPGNADAVPNLVDDLRVAAQDLPAMQAPPQAVVGMLAAVATGAAAIPVGQIMKELGVEDGKLPVEQANIHRLLNAASPEVREQLLVMFLGELFS